LNTVPFERKPLRLPENRMAKTQLPKQVTSFQVAVTATAQVPAAIARDTAGSPHFILPVVYIGKHRNREQQYSSSGLQLTSVAAGMDNTMFPL
jgi:hypothetical protein